MFLYHNFILEHAGNSIQQDSRDYYPNSLPLQYVQLCCKKIRKTLEKHVNKNHNSKYESESESNVQVCLLCHFYYSNLKVYQKHEFSVHVFKTRNKCSFVGLRIQSLQNHEGTIQQNDQCGNTY